MDEKDTKLFDKANELVEKKKYGEAISIYASLLDKYPHNIGVLNNLATTYTSMGDCNGALRILKVLVELEPNDPNNYINLGVVLTKTKDYKNAIYYFRKAISLESSGAAYNNLGIVYEMLGDNKTALIVYEEGLKYHPKHNDLKNNRDKLARRIDRIR